MAPVRTPSRADVELAGLVSEAGWPTTPRQVRTWRSNGWVDKAEIRTLGRCQGKAAANTEEAFGQALTVAKARGGRRTSPAWIVLTMFARGRSVPEEQLRAAYKAYFAEMGREFAKATDGAEDPLDAAEKIVRLLLPTMRRRPMGRFLLSRAAQFRESPEAVVQSALTVLATALLGGDVSQFATSDADSTDALNELLGATGAEGLAKPVGAAPPIMGSLEEVHDEFLSLFEASSIEALERASQELPPAELAAARDRVGMIFGLVEHVNTITKAAGSPQDAFGTRFASKLPMNDKAIAFLAVQFAVISTPHKRVIEEGFPVIEAAARRVAAVEEMLPHFPKHLQRFLGPEGSGRLKRARKTTQEEFAESFRAFAAQRPDLAQVVAKPVEVEP